MVSARPHEHLSKKRWRGRWFFPCLFLFLATSQGNFGGDALVLFLSARSLSTRGSLAIEGPSDRFEGIPEASGGNPEQAPVGRDGRRYSKYGLLVPVLLAPLVAVGEGLGALLSPRLAPYLAMVFAAAFFPLVGAVFAEVLGRALRRRGVEERLADGVVAAAMVGSMLWPYATTAGTDLVFAFLLFCPCFLLVDGEERAASFRSILLSGLALGGVVLTKVYGFCFIPAFLLLLRRPWRRRDLLLLLAPAIAAMALYGLANVLRFGHVLHSGYDPREQLLFGGALPNGLALFFSPGKGLLFYAPPLLLLPFLLRRPSPGTARLALHLLGLAITALGLFAPLEYWNGDLCWGPRYLLPLVAPAYLLLGLTLSGAGQGFRKACLVLALLGVLVQVPAVWLNVDRYVEAMAGPGRHAVRTWHEWRLSPLLGNWRLLAGRPLPERVYEAEEAGRCELWIAKVDRLSWLSRATRGGAWTLWICLVLASLVLWFRLFQSGTGGGSSSELGLLCR